MQKFIKVKFLFVIFILFPSFVFSQKLVKLKVDKKFMVFTTTLKTVKQVLQKQKVVLNLLDRVYPSLNTPLKQKNFIKVVRVEKIKYQATEIIPFKTVFVVKKNLQNAQRIIQYGKNGQVNYTVIEFYKNGVKTKAKTINKKVISKPIKQVVAMGLTKMLSSRGYYLRKTLQLTATAYSIGACLGCDGRGKTYTGLPAKKGVVAVDPKVIPLGSKLYIPNYGFAIAADIGSAIKGMRIDLCFDKTSEVYAFGKKKITVYLLGK